MYHRLHRAARRFRFSTRDGFRLEKTTVGGGTEGGKMIKRYIVAFSTLFSAVLILVMVLTALAQIRPGSSGDVLPDHRPPQERVAEADPHQSPEREAHSAAQDRSDLRIGRGSGGGPGGPEAAVPMREIKKG